MPRTAWRIFIKLCIIYTVHIKASMPSGPEGTEDPTVSEQLHRYWAHFEPDWPMPLPDGPWSPSRLCLLPLGLVGLGSWRRSLSGSCSQLSCFNCLAPLLLALAYPRPWWKPLSSWEKSFTDIGVQQARTGTDGGVGQCPGEGSGTVGRELWPAGSDLLAHFLPSGNFYYERRKKINRTN